MCFSVDTRDTIHVPRLGHVSQGHRRSVFLKTSTLMYMFTSPRLVSPLLRKIQVLMKISFLFYFSLVMLFSGCSFVSHKSVDDMLLGSPTWREETDYIELHRKTGVRKNEGLSLLAMISAKNR